MASTTFTSGTTIIPAAWLNDVNDFVYGGILPPALIVDVGNGGTGANNAADARFNLGLQIGVDVQAYDAFLSTLSGLSNGIVVKTTGSAVSRTITGTANKITVTNGDGVSGNPTLNVGSDIYQVGGTDVAVTDGGTGASSASQALINLGANIFSTIAVSGQSDVVADSPTDTLTLVAGTNVTITTNAATDAITINAAGSGSPGGSNGAMQWNNSSALAGDNNFTTNGTGTLTLTGTINGTSIPSSKTLTVTTDNLSVFAATTSAELRGVLSDETGTGFAVFNDSPTLVTPSLGAATATSINNTTIPSSKTLVVTTDIGSSVQGYSAQLASAASVGDGIVAHTAANTFTPRTLTGTANLITITNGDGVSGDPTFTVGSNVYQVGGTDVAVTDGGTGVSTMTTAYAPVCAGTTATGALQTASTGLSTAGWVLTSNGSSALPSFQAPASSVNLGIVYTMAYGIITL